MHYYSIKFIVNMIKKNFIIFYRGSIKEIERNLFILNSKYKLLIIKVISELPKLKVSIYKYIIYGYKTFKYIYYYKIF